MATEANTLSTLSEQEKKNSPAVTGKKIVITKKKRKISSKEFSRAPLKEYVKER